MAESTVSNSLDKVELITLRYVDTLMRKFTIIEVMQEIDKRIAELEERTD